MRIINLLSYFIFVKILRTNFFYARYIDGDVIKVLSNGGTITENIIKHSEYSLNLMRVFSLLANDKGLKFINVGANIGSTVRNAKYFGFQNILAIEPSSLNYKALNDNCKRYGVETVKAGVGELRGEAVLNINEGSNGRNSFVRSSPTGVFENVEILPLDDIWTKECYLFADVEGYELEVLKGAKKILKSCVSICIELSSRKMAYPEEVYELIVSNFGFYYVNGLGVIDAEKLYSMLCVDRVDQIDLIAHKEEISI
jgi:FkbM family methyltransferase